MAIIRINGYELDDVEEALVREAVMELKHRVYQDYRSNPGMRAGKTAMRSKVQILSNLVFRIDERSIR